MACKNQIKEQHWFSVEMNKKYSFQRPHCNALGYKLT